MRKVCLLVVLLVNVSAFGQKVMREYYNNFLVQYEWQVDANGVKQGYFRSYATDGTLYEAGNYNKGEKSGTWTTYGIAEGHPAEISATIEYKDGKMNGRYVQYCWSRGKRYVCSDRTYRDDEELTKLSYYPNGQLSEQIDKERKIYNKWFEDGQPSSIVKDGKQYDYYQNGDGYRSVTDVSYDSLNMSIFVEYPYRGQLGNVQLRVKSSECKRCGSLITEYKFENVYKIEIFNENGKVKLDSLNLREAYEFYTKIPDPNGTKVKSPYNPISGDVKVPLNNGYQLYHISREGGILYINEYDNMGVLVYSEDSLGNSYYYKEGVLQEYFSADKFTKRSYDNKGILVSEEITSHSNPSKTTFYKNGKIQSQIGYINGVNRAPVNIKFYESGRVQWNIEPNPNDSLQFNNRGFEFADNDEQTLKAYIVFSRWDNTKPSEESVYKIEEVQKLAVEDYKLKLKGLKKQIDGYLGVQNAYPKTQLVFEKIMKIVSTSEANIMYGTDFETIDIAFKLVKHINNSKALIVVPENEDDIKKLKKSKESSEVLLNLGIPMLKL